MTAAWIQDMAYAINTACSALQRLSSQWRDFALAGRFKDPMYVVIQLREQARKFYELANEIEQRVGNGQLHPQG